MEFPKRMTLKIEVWEQLVSETSLQNNTVY